MPYATATNLLEQFGAEEIAQRADRGTPRLVTAAMLKAAAAAGSLAGYTADEQAATAEALALVNAKLLDADSAINGYLATRYPVPLATVPRLVLVAACDLARYALYDDMATETITTRYKDAVKLLEAISKGLVNLGVDASGAKPETNNAAQMVSAGKVFGRDGRRL
ncbi:hypothetical protein SKTS_13580 [Sulfurimicrobium lacus]|uniref:DUF1320 domain-containing protein n=1 Tax=Sulfurimicrobium lacus TaxID=2715678 RepID=A0A6F8VBX8_9PROT|nr:phage protein Gp36 family protein [Sulfurimicrobium lacus]BCB26472.1 hypothetical protein SKTS_13580 [Sulfurimicrobium lacus]